MTPLIDRQSALTVILVSLVYTLAISFTVADEPEYVPIQKRDKHKRHDVEPVAPDAPVVKPDIQPEPMPGPVESPEDREARRKAREEHLEWLHKEKERQRLAKLEADKLAAEQAAREAEEAAKHPKPGIGGWLLNAAYYVFVWPAVASLGLPFAALGMAFKITGTLAFTLAIIAMFTIGLLCGAGIYLLCRFIYRCVRSFWTNKPKVQWVPSGIKSRVNKEELDRRIREEQPEEWEP